MIVMKFGGTSVEDVKAITRVAKIVQCRLKQKPVVVVSAMGGVTDCLVAMGRFAAAGDLPQAMKQFRVVRQRHLSALGQLPKGSGQSRARNQITELFGSLQDLLRGVAALGELSPRSSDNLLSFGEMCSSVLVTAIFEANGLDSAHVDSRKCMITNDAHTKAVPLFDLTNARMRSTLKPLLASGKVPVMGGFIGGTTDGTTTTLGRGGSDFSAAIVGAALSAKRIEIWTDVEGMLTTDPRLVPNAQRIEVISFEEASELAYFGAKVLHPATLIPAVERNIPVYVLNSRNIDSTGTCIRAKAPHSKGDFRAIAIKKGVQIVNVKAPRMLMANGFLRALFEAFEKHGFSADLVSTSEVSVSVTLESARDVTPLVNDLKKLGAVEVEKGKAIVCMVGSNIRGKVGIAGEVFKAVADARINIHMISQGASEINIGFVIEESQAAEALKHLHAHFFEQSLDAGPKAKKNGIGRRNGNGPALTAPASANRPVFV